MAIYSTFFLCEPKRLSAGFPRWKLPLPQPVTRKMSNPFTGQETTITTREPEWDDADDAEMPKYGVVAMEGEYQTYLEQRIPPFVQSQAHWCSKSLTTVELKPLVVATTGAEVELECALYAPPSLACGLVEFPPDFVTRLKTADKAELDNVGRRWAATMSTPDYTHSVDGKRLSNDWTLDDALGLLTPIAELVRQHADGQSLYLLMEA